MENFVVTPVEAQRLLRVLDYMERKASKSEYWAKELVDLRQPGGMIERLRKAVAK